MLNKIEIKEEGVLVLTSTEPFWIDREDLDKIKDYKWRIGSQGYPETTMNKKRMRVYWLLGYEKEKCDHINGNKLDNRKSNLRKFEFEWQNMGNQKPRKNNTTGYQGVSKTKNGNFLARIGFQMKRYNLGTYKTPEEAARARDKKAKELLGRFAYLNFPEGV